LDAVIAKDASEDDIITDYSITKINPFVVSSIVDESNKNNVESYFLEQPTISATDAIARNVFGFFEGYVFPFLFLSFIVSLFRFANNPMGPGGNMPGMPGFQNRKAVDADKINMIKANVSLNSFAGSREIFEECTEVVSYLKNDNTIWEKEPLEELSKRKELKSFKHEKFWCPMDTLRDKEFLENLWQKKRAPWKIW
jgi:ATP-dependent Zn protease